MSACLKCGVPIDGDGICSRCSRQVTTIAQVIQVFRPVAGCKPGCKHMGGRWNHSVGKWQCSECGVVL